MVSSVGWTIFLVFVCSSASANSSKPINLLPLSAPSLANSIHKNEHRTYLEWESVHWNYPRIADVDKFLVPDRNCLVVVDNFRIVDLAPLKKPLIVRQPYAIMAAKKELNYFGNPLISYNLLWSSVSKLRTSANFSENDMLTCSDSRFLTGKTLFNSFCMQLNFLPFARESKPWNCEVHFYLYPPLHFSGFLKSLSTMLPPVFNYSFPKSMENTLPSPNSNLHAFIQHDEKHKINHTLQEEMLNTLKSSFRNISHDIFLLITVETLKSKNYLAYQTGKIKLIQLIRYCSGCKYGKVPHYWSFTLITLPNFQHFFSMSKLENLAFPSLFGADAVDLQVGKVSKQNPKSLADFIVRGLQNCENQLLIPNLFKKKQINDSAFDSPAKELASAFIHIWSNILENITIFSYGYTICINWSKPVDRIYTVHHKFELSLTLVPYLRGTQFHSQPIQDPSYKLRFVSCGRRGMSPFPFYDLVIVFDDLVWLSILASIVSMIVLITLVTRNIGYFLSPVKVLLEQGGPFSKSSEDNTNFRYAIGSLLLMGIILSNAYKNTNVYDMIIPRKPVPFETFKELTTHNFSIYTRSGPIHICDKLHSTLVSCTCEGTVFSVNDSTVMKICVAKEISFIVSKAVDTLTSFTDKSPNSESELDFNRSELRLAMRVENVSILHPSLAQYLMKVGRAYRQRLPALQDDVARIEPKFLWDSLESCQKIAIIQPEYLCWQSANLLKRKRKLRDAFVGKEVYSDVEWYFALKGLLHPGIIRRFKGIVMAGIWNWRMRMVVGSHNKYDGKSVENETPKPASMRGNVVVIFAVWMCGIMISAKSFILEVMISLFRGVCSGTEFLLEIFTKD